MDNINEANGKKIASIEKVMRILGCFDAQHKEIGLAALSQMTGYPKTTLFGLVATLLAEGMLTRMPNSANYTLGTKLLELAYNVRLSLPIVQIAAPVLNHLNKQSDQNVYLTTHTRGRVLFLESCYRSREYVGYSEAGKTLPMHCTACGKAMLAFMAPERVDAIIAMYPPEKKTPNSITDPGLLRMELADIRGRGFALDMEEETLGVRCVAAPVLNAEGVPVGAISMSGSAVNMTRARMYEFHEMIAEKMPLLRMNAQYFPYSFT